MVKGLDVFHDYFHEYTDQYVLIGVLHVASPLKNRIPPSGQQKIWTWC